MGSAKSDPSAASFDKFLAQANQKNSLVSGTP